MTIKQASFGQQVDAQFDRRHANEELAVPSVDACVAGNFRHGGTAEMIRQTSMTRTPTTYPAFLAELKGGIRSARLQAALSVNRELILLYWSIGRDILSCQDAKERGVSIIDRMATDLRRTFPEMTGVSARDLEYMRAFARAWPEVQVVHQVAAQLPWGHHIELLNAVKSPAEREWYAREAIQSGWSRAVLAHQIEGGLYARRQKGSGKGGPLALLVDRHPKLQSTRPRSKGARQR